MYGPNTNPGGGIYIFIAECQARYTTDLLVRSTEAGVGSLECRQDVHDEFNRQVDALHGRIVWAPPGTGTYYRNPAGGARANRPWRGVDTGARPHTPALDDLVAQPSQDAHRGEA